MRPSRVAIHESGHALVAWILGATGVCAVDQPTADRPNTAGTCRYNLPHDADDAAVAFAGRAAELLLIGRASAPEAYSGDWSDAVDAVNRRGGTALDIDLSKIRARAILHRHRPALSALAARLTVRGIVTDTDLAETTGITPGEDRLAQRLADGFMAEYRRHKRKRAAAP